MTIWFVIDTSTGPPNAVDVFRIVYLATNIRGHDNPDEPEALGEPIEGRDGKYMIGSSRITTAQANGLTAGRVPWIENYDEFPPPDKWQPKPANP